MPVAKEQIRQIISENNLNSVTDVYALLRDSFKDILQELMEAELDAALGYEKNHKGNLQTDNKRNGHSPKNLKSQYGEFQIDVPRDRNGEFEPKLIPKYQRDISGIEEKVISLYARGMSTRDIHDQLNDLYGIELSAEMVSKITDKILPQVKEWQSRPLNPVYPFVFMDCIHYKVREDGRILSRAAYVVLGVTAEGYKEILSITVGANETSKFWLGMLNDLHVVFQIKRAANLQIILAPYKIDVVLQPHYPETLLHITRTKILPCKLIAQEYSVSSYENGSSSSSIWQA